MTPRRLIATLAAVTLGALAGCGTAPSSEPTPPPSTTSTQAPSTPPESGASPSTEGSPSAAPSASAPTSGPGTSGSPSDLPTGRDQLDLARHKPALSWQEALAIATKQFEGKLTSIELSWERGELVYEVELVSDTHEYEVEISAADGEVLRHSTDSVDDDESLDQKVIDTPGIVNVDDAMAAATERVPGRVVEWKLDRNKRGIYFEFDIVDGAKEIEVAVDAATGKVIKVDD